MIVEGIKALLEEIADKPDMIKVGYIKEYLQAHILKQIYSNESTNGLIFYGWTCLRFLFGLNRLSEDLDFVSKDFEDFEGLAEQFKKYFAQFDIPVEVKVQKFRIILKFKKFLGNFGLKYWNSSDLYIKVEISSFIDFCKNYKVELYPIFKYNFSILVKSFDEPTLFATKINAVLNRKWTRHTAKGVLSVKWRDIYDLFWWLSRDVKPNVECIIWVKNIKELKGKLKEVIKSLNFDEVVEDIKNFVEDLEFVEFFSKQWKDYLLKMIEKM